MAPHSSTLAWTIPWTEEPGGLQSMGLLRVGHDWATDLIWFYIVKLIMFPLWLAIVINFYFLSGYWLWKLINIFYFCDYITHLIPLYHDWYRKIIDLYITKTREQFSWVPLPYCSPPGCPFPIKSLVLSAHVSPRTIHFRVLDKSPVLGPGRGPPSCNKWWLWWDSSSLRLTSWHFKQLKCHYPGHTGQA